jgi:hypothetical protein
MNPETLTLIIITIIVVVLLAISAVSALVGWAMYVWVWLVTSLFPKEDTDNEPPEKD